MEAPEEERRHTLSVQVTVENEGEITRLLQTLPPEIFERVQQVLKNGAVRVAERARELVPVRTGHLLASIRPELGEELEEEDAFQEEEQWCDFQTFAEDLDPSR